MRKHSITVIICAASIISALFTWGCAAPPAETPPTETPSGEPIPVAFISDMTGPLGMYGVPQLQASQMAIDHINAEGGVLGRPLKLLVYDAQSTIELYVQYATDAVINQNVAVIQGGVTSASREAMRESVIDRYDVILFYNYEYEGGEADKLVFCTGITLDHQAGYGMPWAVEEWGPKFYNIAADYNYGWAAADWCQFYGEEAGGELVGEEFVPLDVADFTTSIAKIQAANPDFVASQLVGANHISFYRQYNAAGLKAKIPIFSTTYGLGSEQSFTTPDEHEGIVVPFNYFEDLANPVNEWFVPEFYERFGRERHIYPAIADQWSAWHLWATGVELAGSLDTWDVIAALESGIDYDSPEGLIRMNPHIHHLERKVYLGRGNRSEGFDIIMEFPFGAPPWHVATYDLVKNPELRTQFLPELD